MNEHPLYKEVGLACARHATALQRWGKGDRHTKSLKTKYVNANKEWVAAGKPKEAIRVDDRVQDKDGRTGVVLETPSGVTTSLSTVVFDGGEELFCFTDELQRIG